MATYKVIQDIESEDKLLGPLSLRQFIYAAVVVMLGFVAFKLMAASPLLVLPFLPPMLFFGLLAAPFGQDQSSEVWLLARIRFFLKPRRRIWDQSGVLDLVTITAPKKPELQRTDGLTQGEVKSRLQALANTIDSRGWAVKNVNVNLFSQPGYLASTATASDRLLDSSNLPQDVPAADITAADDMLDERSNPTAQHLQAMINQSTQAHHQAAVATAQGQAGAQPPLDYWFMHQPDPGATPQGYATFTHAQTVLPGTDISNNIPDAGAEDAALLEKIHKEKSRPNPGYGHMRVIDPNGSSKNEEGKIEKGKHPSKETAIPRKDPELLSLAARDDLNVSTIAHEASKQTDKKPHISDDGEVTISLR